jgi:hypothetical protein
MGGPANTAGCLDIGDLQVSAIAALYGWRIPCLFAGLGADPPFLRTSTFEQTFKNIAFLVNCLPVLVGLTPLKQNRVITDTADGKPLLASDGVINPGVNRHGSGLPKNPLPIGYPRSKLGTEQYCAP